jgi:hypothetical protein
MALDMKSTGLSGGNFGAELDDYEEGTITYVGVNFTVSSISHAVYNKIAKLVTNHAYISGASGNGSAASITGGPYATSNNGYAPTVLNHSQSNTNVNNPHVRIGSGTSTIFFHKDADGVSAGQDIDGSHIIFCLTYVAAA